MEIYHAARLKQNVRSFEFALRTKFYELRAHCLVQVAGVRSISEILYSNFSITFAKIHEFH